MASLRARLAAAVPGWGWLLLAGCYAAACWANIVTRTQWISDSRLYLAWSYRYLGLSEADAAHRTHNFLVNMDGVRGGCDAFCWNPGYEHDFFSGANGAVVGARPLYPLLSAPFVAAFGPNGMLVVPVLSYALAVAVVAVLAHRLWGRHWGLLAGLLLIIPATVSRFAVYGMTEALALALTVAALLFLPLGRSARRGDPLWFGVLLVLGLCVRQFGIALTAGVLLAWLVVALRDRRPNNAWWPFALVAAGVTVATLVAQSVVTSVWFSGGSLNLTGRYQKLTCQALHHCGVTSLPWGLRYIGRADYGALRQDLVLLAGVVLALAAVLWRRRSELTALVVGAVLATAALNLLVVWPSYYRYFVPVHPLILLAGLGLVADFAARPRRQPSRSTEAAPDPVGIGPPRPTVSLAGWVLLALTFLGAVFVVWRRDHPPAGTGALALSFLCLAFTFLVLVWRVTGRSGASAGVLAGLTLALSGALAGRALASWRDAVLLAAATGVAALLPADRPGPAAPGSPGGVAGRGRRPGREHPDPGPPLPVPGRPDSPDPRRLAGLAVLLGVAAAVSPIGLAVDAGLLAGWLAATARQRRAVNGWTLPAGIAVLVGLVAGGVRAASGGMSWHVSGWAHAVSVDFRAVVPDRLAYLVVLVGVIVALVRWYQPASWYALGTVGVALLLQLGRPAVSAVTAVLPGYAGLLLVLSGALASLVAPGPSAPVTAGRPVPGHELPRVL